MDFSELIDPIDTLAAPLQTNEVAVIDRHPLDLENIDLTKLALARFGNWREKVYATTENLSTLVLDLSTAAKCKEARSLRQRLIGDPMTEARKVAAGIKSKMAQTSKIVGAELDAIENAYQECDALILPKIDARESELAAERAERERIEREKAEAHAARLATVNGYADRCRAPDMTSERIALGMARLEAADLSDPDNARAVELADARCRTLETMRVMMAQAQSREAEAARQEAIRIENERQAAALAEERRRIEAEAAEIRRQAAELAAQRAESERQQMIQEAAKMPDLPQARVGEIMRELRNVEQPMTGTPESHLSQDLSAGLSESLASKPDAMMHAREAAAAIAAERADAAPEAATIKLGTLCDELGFKITEAFIRDTLKIERSGTDKQAILYTATKRLQILGELVRHVQGVMG